MRSLPRSFRLLAIAGFVALAAGCASDEVTPPGPTLREPGTFVAVDEGKGYLTLYRTLDTFAFEEETLLFLRTYDVAPQTPEEARAIARSGDLPILYPVSAVDIEQFPSGPSWIVWFRTLTEAEIALSQ